MAEQQFEGDDEDPEPEVGRDHPDRREPGQALDTRHVDSLSGQDDVPENYHTVTYEIEDRQDATRVRLSQDNNPTAEAAEHSRENWEMVLAGLKEVVERG